MHKPYNKESLQILLSIEGINNAGSVGEILEYLSGWCVCVKEGFSILIAFQ